MPKTYRIFLSLLCFTMLLASCNNRARKEEETFIKQVNTIEENPQSALSKYKKYNIRSISGLDEATTFLFQSLAQFYSNDSMPDKNMLLQCSRLFQEKRRFHQQLETLCLLTEIYNQENQFEPELETLEQAIDIALKHNETEWLFLLYSRLSNMYYQSLDFLEYVKYQTLANKYIQKNYDAEKLSSNEVLLIAENYLYTDHCEKALNTLQSIQLKQEHWLYGKHKFLLGVTYSKLEQWDKAINEFETYLKVANISQEYKLLAHTTLAYSYMQLGLTSKAYVHKNHAMVFDTDSLNSFTAIAIYQTLNDINRIAEDKDAEMHYMQKISVYRIPTEQQNLGRGNTDLYQGAGEKSTHEKDPKSSVCHCHDCSIDDVRSNCLFLPEKETSLQTALLASKTQFDEKSRKHKRRNATDDFARL